MTTPPREPSPPPSDTSAPSARPSIAPRRLSVRFSSDIPRAPSPVPIDSRLPVPPDRANAPPPRHRSRGYSLRRQLFFRNAQDAGVLAHSSSADTMEMGALATTPSPPDVSGKSAVEEEDAELVFHGHPPEKLGRRERIGREVQTWLDGLGVAEKAEAARKWIMREKDIPPSKEGRKIPLRAEQREKLVDERTGRDYISNWIRSSRYTVWNFLPKQLFYQFSKLANFYFLCVSILQMIPTLSTTGTYTTIVPLCFFIALSMFKEGYDDYRRYREDKVENRRETSVCRIVEDPDGKPTVEWATVKWSDIKVGDVLQLERDDWVPADLVILHAEADNGIAYIETMALDGETNLKSKQAIPAISELCDTPEKLARVEAEVVVEDPNLDLYNFEGKVHVGGETKPLTNNQIVYRGSVLRNTESMIGMVIFTGEETKIRMNANKNPRTKAPALQGMVNKIVIMTVFFVLLLATFCSVAYYKFWRETTEEASFYLDGGSVPFFPIFASYIIMFNTLIPLSLYVSLEIVKVAQMFFLNDIDMYHEESDTPFEAHTSTINEDCGQISYIFSDKTGTLTDNSMLFRKMSVGGQAWLHDVDLKRPDPNDKILHKKRKPKKGKNKDKKKDRKGGKSTDRTGAGRKSLGDMGYTGRKSMGDLAYPSAKARFLGHKESESSLRWKSTADPSRPQPQLSTMDLLGYLQQHPHTFFARKARFFLLAIALCHTCLPEVDEDGEIDYSAASPDELALVRAAQQLDYIAIDRDMNTITIKSYPSGPNGEPLIEVYQILEVIEFSSKRKRMSIVIRFPSGKICIFCKGADTTLLELLRLRDLAKEKVREVERRASIRRSIEVQEQIRRNSMARTSIGGLSSIGRPSITLPRTSLGQRPSMSNRPSFSGRPSLSRGPSFSGGRPSMTGPSRVSMAINRLKPIRDLDEWIREREEKELSFDEESLYSRPSAQITRARHSIAFGEGPLEPVEYEDEDAPIVDEDLALDDAKVFERCFAHVNHFATEGLRTLLYGHRFLEEHEYNTWKKIYTDATTSLVDRQALIERAAELIERDFELTGATAIEDKLQAGVPEAIDKLRRAGIKLWMLTGDKRETAINIGHSCRLIKDFSTVTILDAQDLGLSRKMKNAMQEIHAGNTAHSVVVVDGATLASIDADPLLQQLFFELAVLTDSVICCRASPSQKASLVKTIRTKVQQSVTLAIGDGANDIAMIQEAHVGVGITGKEGLQAARVSDYSMAQFRFLLKFLLVHGRWNYIRTCKYVAATFWKEMLFYLTQALFQYWNGYTGSSLYEPWTLTMFNTLFTSLPVIFLGIFEKDLAASTLLAVPELYSKGQRNAAFNFRIYFGWMLLAVCQSMLVFFTMYALYIPNITVDRSVYAMGVLTYTVCVTLINLKCQLIETNNKSVTALISFLLSLLAWWLWNLVLSAVFSPSAKNNTIHHVARSLLQHFGREWNWWLVVILATVACLLLDVTAITVRVAFWPQPEDVFREVEKDEALRRRLEEEASDELQQGWKRGSWRREQEEGVMGVREAEERLEKGFGTVKAEREAGV